MKDVLKINGSLFQIELAVSSAEQERGLMHRHNLPEAMVFVYKTARLNKFWMHQTPSPLDIVFARKNQILDICHGIPYSTTLIGKNILSDLVIEFPLKTCELHRIKIGDLVDFSLSTTSRIKILKNSV